MLHLANGLVTRCYRGWNIPGHPTSIWRLGRLPSNLQARFVHIILLSFSPLHDVCYGVYYLFPSSPSPMPVAGEHSLPVVIRSFAFRLVSATPFCLLPPSPFSPRRIRNSVVSHVLFVLQIFKQVSVNEHLCIISPTCRARVLNLLAAAGHRSHRKEYSHIRFQLVLDVGDPETRSRHVLPRRATPQTWLNYFSPREIRTALDALDFLHASSTFKEERPREGSGAANHLEHIQNLHSGRHVGQKRRIGRFSVWKSAVGDGCEGNGCDR